MKRKTASITLFITLLIGLSSTFASRGSIYVGPMTSGEAVRILSTAYVLQPLTNACPGCIGIIVGPADLSNPSIVNRLQAAYNTKQPVGLTNATVASIRQLHDLLQHRGSAEPVPGGAQVDLVAFRKAQRPDGQFHFSSHLLLPRIAAPPAGPLLTKQEKKRIKRLSNKGLRRKLRTKLTRLRTEQRERQQQQHQRAADTNDIQALSRIFSARPEVPEQAPLGSSPQQNLINLAESYQSHAIRTSDRAGTVQVVNSVWAVRSFLNNVDFYYVFQETDFSSADMKFWRPNATSFLGFPTDVTLIQTSPQSTMESTQETSSVSYTVGGSAGWNETEGLNASVSGSVTITKSKTTTIPAMSIRNSADIQAAIPIWNYNVNDLPGDNVETITLYNQWIWEVPFSFYNSSQQDLSFGNNALLGTNFDDGAPEVVFTSTLPLPFGRTFALQPPAVTGVSPSCVNSGDQFTIQGTGLYPSLVQSVLIGGTAVNPANITTVSDTQINVIAPDTVDCHGAGCSVAIQTAQGTSNTNFTIAISDFCD